MGPLCTTKDEGHLRGNRAQGFGRLGIKVGHRREKPCQDALCSLRSRGSLGREAGGSLLSPPQGRVRLGEAVRTVGGTIRVEQEHLAAASCFGQVTIPEEQGSCQVFQPMEYQL